MLIGVTTGSGTEQIDVPEDEVLNFPHGVIGFEELKRFVLFELEGPLHLLQSVDDAEIGFVVLDPFLVAPHYRVTSQQACETLGLSREDERAMLCIVTMSREGRPISVNLRAPIVLNPSRHLGMQLITDEEWPVRHPFCLDADGGLLLDERPGLAAAGGSRC